VLLVKEGKLRDLRERLHGT
jgi:hypothetical protein